MRKMKWFATVLLTVVLVVVSACSQNSGGNEEPDNNKATDAPVTETAAPTEAPPVVEEPAIDMNGETLKIIHWIDGPSEETPEGALTLAKWKEAEEKYNVKIVWEKVPWGENIKMVTNAALSGE
ncbi:hypothetical protein AB4Z21_26160, partial [Paenibacillus sp. MCAF20]